MKPLPLAAMITSMGLMVAARALGQQLPDYPRWNIEPGFGVVWHQQATFTTVSGPIVPSVLVKPYPDVRLGFIYRDSPRLALLISAGVAQVPFSTGYSMGAASDSAGRVIWNEGRYTLPGGEWFRFEAELGAKITALRRGRWHCNGVVGARPSHLRHVLAEAHSGEIIDSAIRPHTSLVGFLNDGWHLAGRAGAEVEYCFKNFNRLHIGIDYWVARRTSLSHVVFGVEGSWRVGLG